MTLLKTDLIAIVIALVGCVSVMILFWKKNIQKEKEIRRLRNELRKLLKV